MKRRCYQIPTEDTVEAVKTDLGQAFASLDETIETATLDVWDTFDWRLYNNGWLLLKQARQYTLIDINTDLAIARIHVEGDKPRRFHWEFSASELTDRLKGILEMRALLPVLAIQAEYRHIAVRNNDEKTVVRLNVESLEVTDAAITQRRCFMEPVRGYAREARAVRSIAGKLALTETEESAVPALLLQSGASPGTYSSKVRVSLQPEMPAAEAVRRIMENLVSVMHANLPGVRDDIDSEFLHDLRVSVRRARSLLGQIKGVLSADTTARLQGQLKAMGTITGPVRDLDVYLLKEETYTNQVPPFLQPGVKQLFQTLKRKRRTARNHMLKAMDTPDFAAAMAGLDEFVATDTPEDPDAPAAAMPIGEIAKAAIYKRWRRVVKKGSRIKADTPDERLHELRIDCKKLRYLLEFFTSLFPPDEMKKLIKQLKQLQENLGDFNDLSVQQDFLMQHLSSVRPRSAQVVILSAATGGLITHLAMDQKSVRDRFLGVFAAFNAPGNRNRFKSLSTG
ncbi:CHAD domain-containing protein [Desulfosarcina ovata]|uniref:CHAD domain-containing protein n=1 Tax=Desulfosarcina ovata subsp. ovata TaxID=2752305 RepID=A0A5K8AKL1_9BACT|nr:CHAD domain-containing protein [Desulfosarcina ovata]BBO93036.1 CHAD domain-containing protein [Desulfosarcina ovata subsp. ovata]